MTTSPPANRVWSEAERKAWEWPASQRPSQWSEENRVLSPDVTSEPGPWRNDRVPYAVGIMDAFVEPAIEEIVCIKGAQVSWSEIVRNVLGFCIDRDPGPALVVMPDEKSAKELIEERIKPLIDSSPAVARHKTSRAWDVKSSAIKLDAMSIYVAWARSSQALKSRPIRYLFLEEPDEYPDSSGPGGDPISKALMRLTTYAASRRARAMIGGTPTTRRGNIWKQWEKCGEQYYYWVPCPHCGKYQRFEWGRVKYDPRGETETRSAHSSRVLSTGAAWYVCEHCKEKVVEEQKAAMLRRGAWATLDQVVRDDGSVVGPRFTARRVGFSLSALYSPWVSWARLASEWILAQEDRGLLMDFVNQRLAEPFEELRSKSDPTIIARKAKNGPPPELVPAWAKLLIATADTQGADERSGYFYYVIRAWGYNYRSQLVKHGVAQSKAECKHICLEQPILMEGGSQVVPICLLADTGGPRWSEIYQWALSDPTRIKPTKGMSHSMQWLMDEKPQRTHQIVLWRIDTEQSQDLLHRLIFDPDMGKWMPNAAVIDQGLELDAASDQSDYCRQMKSKHKVVNPRTRREEWIEIVKNNDHYWDCEAQQVAAAWHFKAGLPEPPTESQASEPENQDHGFYPPPIRVPRG